MALFCAAVNAPCAAEPNQPPAPSTVRLVETARGFVLERQGKPFFIRGAGGHGSLDLLAKSGGNSIRTWSADHLESLLDEAHHLGLTVTVGLWLGHERHGFSYNDADQVAQQIEAARAAIFRYRDHPALLLWGIGNEMEGYGNGDNAAIWSAVNNLAALAKKLDPHHPTMTVIAEIGGDRVRNLHRLCPDIDIVGINSYGGLSSLPERYRKAGGVKPFVVAEFGPPGRWEVEANSWGVAPEPTSTAKADIYREGYQKGILGSGGLCLGSYAFYWGNKQEGTATWFGMLLPDGSRLAPVDVLQELWTGRPPLNFCPRILELHLAGHDQIKPETIVRAFLKTSDPEDDPLRVQWVLQGEPLVYSTGGDEEESPPTYPEAILKNGPTQCEVRLPRSGGGYRLHAFVHDNHGGAASANIPLFVQGPVILPRGRPATLPLVLYDEAGTSSPPFVPSGWMGNLKALKFQTDCPQQPHSGKTCLRIEYTATDGWAGIVWQHPANDWGNRLGGWDLAGAKRLTFWARGQVGGETVTFELGILGKEKKVFDTARGKLDQVVLTETWRRYSIDLRAKDLSRIKTGFAFVINGQERPVVFYLDDIQYAE